MSRPFISLMVLFGLCLSIQAQAASPKYARKPVPKTRPQIQQHYSFVPTSQPSETLARLQTTLTGRVEVKQPEPTAEPSTSALPQPEAPPSVILSTLTPPAPPSSVTSQPLATLAKSTQHNKADSWVDTLNAREAAQLSEMITAYIQSQCPEKQTALALAELPVGQQQNALTLSLKYALQRQGYTLARTAPAIPIRYRISRFNRHGLLVRIRINDTEIARFYERSNSGTLVAASPLSRIAQGAP